MALFVPLVIIAAVAEPEIVAPTVSPDDLCNYQSALCCQIIVYPNSKYITCLHNVTSQQVFCCTDSYGCECNDETDGYDNKSSALNYDKLKSIVMSATININRKGIEAFEDTNYLRIICFTNDTDVYLENGQRRWFINTASPVFKGNILYFDKLGNHLKNKDVANAFMYFLSVQDITQWDPQNIPMTGLKKSVLENNITYNYAEAFIRQYKWRDLLSANILVC